MQCIKINGIQIAKIVKNNVKQKVNILKKNGIKPCLATILIGNNSASLTYIKNKHNACKDVGIATIDYKLANTVSETKIIEVITKLNKNKKVHGILIQLPLPKKLNAFKIISKISPYKDVDGLTPYNMGLLSINKKMLVACTPSGIMKILEHHKIKLSGKNVIIINRSNLIGKPLQNLLVEKNATVILCHSKTLQLKKLCKISDIVITAVGNRSKFILTEDMIKEKAIIIDVAISRDENNKLVGDADFNNIQKKASYITPVPGGVGPMTVAMLLKNTIIATTLNHKNV